MVYVVPLVLALLFSSVAFAQAPCTHYASPSGGGNGLAEATPFTIPQFWGQAAPGKTLCLLDGTYTGNNARIEPPTTLHGTQLQPITVRALNDGKVLLDGQAHWTLYLRSTWFIIEGLNAHDGGEFLLGMGGAHNRVRRTIGWNGTHGQNDSNIWRIWGDDNISEDCAGWGNNSRKIFDGAQAGNAEVSGFRRCWGEWNDHPQGASQPNTTYQVGYNTSNQLFENVIGTWNRTGQSANAEAVMSMSNNCDGASNDVTGTRIAGSIMYVPAGASYQPGNVIQGFCLKNLRLRDVVAFVAPGFSGVRPFQFFTGGGQSMSGNVCDNCLGIHAGSPSSNATGAGFATPGFREGQGLAAATGGASPFALLPGICKRYVGGQLTNDPLWPWPMDARIHAARGLSGKAPVTVTTAIEALLGPIPAACRVGTAPPP